MNQLRRPRLVALVAVAGAAVVMAAAPSPAASSPAIDAGPVFGSGPALAAVPSMRTLTELLGEQRPGTASTSKEYPPPRPQGPPRGWHGAPSPSPTPPSSPSTTPPPASAPPSASPSPTTPPPVHPPVQGPRVPDAKPTPSELMARIIELTNRDRAQHGCAPLTPQSALHAAAQSHADDMSQRVYFSHTGLDGRSFDQRMKDAGYPGHQFGENIASGYPTAEEVEAAWMATPGHRKNILECSFKEIGVGYAADGEYWVVNFGA